MTSPDIETPRVTSVTVAVVCICSAKHLARCLDALRQQDLLDFDVLVAADPNIQGLDEIDAHFPEAKIVTNENQRTPLELASCAMRESQGELILLTEDHCIPSSTWVRTMVAAQREDRAVVGGRVEVQPGATTTDWAFYFVDFFRYAHPVTEGPSPTLTVCNASYKKSQLVEIRDLWATYFHETAVNDALRERFGSLWLHGDAEVTMSRHVTLGDAVYERYAFGRLFGCTRIEFVSRNRRIYYACFAPALPLILLGRMARKSTLSPQLFITLLRSIVPLTLMVIAWSWGEWLGYVTGKHPRSLIVAPEIRAAARAQQAE